MRAFVGQTRSRALIAELASMGYGECTNRGEFPPRRHPWFLDNGAFSDWRAGRAFDVDGFERDLSRALVHSERPRFVVCPDRVAGGRASLAFSLRWLDTYESRYPARYYFAIQDGMTERDVRSVAPRFDGLFIGGTSEWKEATGGQWTALARELGMPCHVGRCGSMRKVRWARSIGATSIDSCLPLWSAAKLDRFRRAMAS
jgi:hypothetical protein